MHDRNHCASPAGHHGRAAGRPRHAAGRGARDRAHRPDDGRDRRQHRQRRGAGHAGQPARVRRQPAAHRGRLHDLVRGPAGHRGQAGRHSWAPNAVPGRDRAVHPRVPRLRPGAVGRRACRPAVSSGGRRRGDDPAGAEPDPAHLHGAGAEGAGDDPVRNRHRRRCGTRAGARRPAGEREHRRQHLAAGLPRQRAGRAHPARLLAAAARARAPRPGALARPARPGSAYAGRARLGDTAGARPAARLASLGLGAAGRFCRPVRAARRGGAPGRRPRRAADPTARAAWAAGHGSRAGRDLHRAGGIRRLAVRAGARAAGRAGGVAAAGGADVRALRRRVRAGEPQLAAAARPVLRPPADGRVCDYRPRPALVRIAPALRRCGRPVALRRPRGGGRRTGGRVRAAGDAGPGPDAGGARGGRKRRGRDHGPAGDCGRDRDLRHAVPEPGRRCRRPPARPPAP